jgi:Uma2 family endonuclease
MIWPLVLQPRLHVWTCAEFNRAAQAGAFQDMAIELIDGAIVNMSPMGTPHAGILTIVGMALQELYNPKNGYQVRYQLPLMLDDLTQPQPDLAVVEGAPRDFLLRHPSHALLVIEIADSSLEFDRGLKADRYGEANVEEYWIVNLIDEQLEVFRRSANVTGFAPPQILRRGDHVTLPGLANVTLAVADLLP